MKLILSKLNVLDERFKRGSLIHLSVSHSVHGGMCVCGGGMHTGGLYGRGPCMAEGACMAGGVHGGRTCVVGVCTWQWGVRGGGGACMAGEMATEADSMHPTGIHSCL